MFDEQTLQLSLSWVKLWGGPGGEHSYTTLPSFLSGLPTWHSDRHGLGLSLVQKEKGVVKTPSRELIKKENKYVCFLAVVNARLS